MPQFTKGKWNWEFRADMDNDTNLDYIIFLEPNKEDEIARAYAEGDARLIAAAPDMYKFIQTLYELITNPEEDEEVLSLRFVSEAAKQILDRINVKGGEA